MSLEPCFVTATCQDWSERLDLEGDEWRFGRSEGGVEVRVAHPSVSEQHAQVILRRGRYLVRALSGLSVQVDGAPIRAPVALQPGQRFQLGQVHLHLDRRAGPTRSQLEARWGRLRREWGGPHGARRYESEDGEVVWAPEPGPEAEPFAGGWTWRRALPPGVRLGALLAGLAAGTFTLPPEVAIVVVAQLGEALLGHHREAGAHGAVGPEAVHLGVDGAVRLVDVVPGTPPDEDCMSPERRFGLPPSRPDDVFAFASLGMRLLRESRALPSAWAPLTPLLQSEPRRRSLDVAAACAALRHRSEAGGLDATAHHVARPVKLLVAARANPLLRPGR